MRSPVPITFGLLAAIAVANSASAQCYVIVNGRCLSGQTLRALEEAACTSIPMGNYWLRSGVWGYAGNPVPQGHIGDECPNERMVKPLEPSELFRERAPVDPR